jgi:hypothetical protein
LGEPRFEVISEFSEEVFNEFLDLEAAGWKKLKGGAIKCNPVVAEFYRMIRDRRSYLLAPLLVSIVMILISTTLVVAATLVGNRFRTV